MSARTGDQIFVPQEEQERERLREEHGVRLVSDSEDGRGLHRLPGGVYGFTYSPGLPDTPLFRKRGPLSFEVHKHSGGEVFLIGYLPPEAEPATEIHLAPSSREDATRIVAIPMSRVARIRQHSTRESGTLEAWLEPSH
ncbi:MAG: hypothetical protein HYR60_21405 [Acidobacteria bacterium]|nr:hypothetical protein [Acidobacteriota bacterium]